MLQQLYARLRPAAHDHDDPDGGLQMDLQQLIAQSNRRSVSVRPSHLESPGSAGKDRVHIT